MTKTTISKDTTKDFAVGDSVVYPSHGVGSIIAEETQVIGGMEVSCYVIIFDKDKMTLKVPKNRAEKAGLRQLASADDLDKALITLQGKARVEKGMWSKRAQKYEEKIYSGNVVHIAEVLRDLYRNVDDPGRSYSERIIYESAFQRFINEYAVAANINVEHATQKIKEMLEEAKILNNEAA